MRTRNICAGTSESLVLPRQQNTAPDFFRGFYMDAHQISMSYIPTSHYVNYYEHYGTQERLR